MEKYEIKEFLTKTDNELNLLDYKQALILDNRKFCEYSLANGYLYKYTCVYIVCARKCTYGMHDGTYTPGTALARGAMCT